MQKKLRASSSACKWSALHSHTTLRIIYISISHTHLHIVNTCANHIQQECTGSQYYDTTARYCFVIAGVMAHVTLSFMTKRNIIMFILRKNWQGSFERWFLELHFDSQLKWLRTQRFPKKQGLYLKNHKVLSQKFNCANAVFSSQQWSKKTVVQNHL